MKKKKKEFDFLEFINKDFYIVDCKNFIYFPRKVKISSFELQPYTYPKYFIDEYNFITQKELEQFKTFEEAEKYAKMLNEIPENRKRAEK